MFKRKSLYEKAEENKHKHMNKCVNKLYEEAINSIRFAIRNGRKITSVNTSYGYGSFIEECSKDQEEVYNKVSEMLNNKYNECVKTCIVPTGFMSSYRALEIRIVN